ncbi:hypothetical protein TSUD_115740 [Trifolium subterraneum]|uniref:Gnk2-homologous domain-containing protein n=1 Tax=Trifolium subterraneum TaxID=3900 RepID=A0A2Z6LYW6_TRISU|nr:hypothetical protein TSUD_115740 [Trifolium subterraneum]
MTAPKYLLHKLTQLLSICLCVMMMNLLTTTTTTKATPTYTTTYCTNTNTYASNAILVHFLSRFSRHHRYFFTSRTPWYYSGHNFATSKSIELKGLTLCRRDVTATVCDQCLTAAVNEIRIRCPDKAEALIWYDECFLRYTNRYFDVEKIVPRVNLDDGDVDSSLDLGRFNQSLYRLLNRLVTEAVAAKKVAAGEAVVTEWKKVHGLMQCTDDLTKRRKSFASVL